MKKWMWLCFLLAAAANGVSCRKHDFRTVVIQVPGLRAPECARIIQNAFSGQPGVRSIKPDFAARTLTIDYDSMQIALKNMEFVIADAGFDANEVPACPEAAAKLPPECRAQESDPH